MSEAAKKSKKVKDYAKDAANTSVAFVKDNPITFAKGFIAVLGIYLGYRVVKAVISPKDDPNAAGGNINPNNALGIVPGGTITNGQAVSIAALLSSYMDGLFGVSTSEFNAIKEALKNINTADFWAISRAFGRPYRSPFTGEGSNFYLSIGNDLSLIQWFSKELSVSEYQELRDFLPAGTI